MINTSLTKSSRNDFLLDTNFLTIETSLSEKEDFYSHLNMENTTDGDYVHTKRLCEDFEIKNLGEYLDLYVQSDTLL